MPNATTPHWSSLPLSLLHLEGARDLTASPADRLHHAGHALAIAFPDVPIRLENAWAGAIDLGAVRFVLEYADGEVGLGFEEACDEVDREIAAGSHLKGERCHRDECQDCEEREIERRIEARERYLDGLADAAWERAKEERVERAGGKEAA